MVTPPTLYILCGKVGSGKSTLARYLESRGTLRLSQDEYTLSRVQTLRKPEDYYRVIDEKTLRAAEAEARAEILEIALSALRGKRSVVIDDGFWRKAERESYRLHAARAGARSVLYYLPIEPDQQWQRLSNRNQGDLTLVHYISLQDMEYLNTFFEPPINEGEVPLTTLPYDEAAAEIQESNESDV